MPPKPSPSVNKIKSILPAAIDAFVPSRNLSDRLQIVHARNNVEIGALNFSAARSTHPSIALMAETEIEMFKRSVLTLGAVALMGGAALAQTTAPTTAPTTVPGTAPVAAPPAAMPGSAGTMGGMRMADTAAMPVKYVDVKPADVMSSKLVGTNVYNRQNETLGEIEDLVIENGRTLTGVVVSVGGFLGMGEHYVVLDPSTVAVSNKDGKWAAHVDTTKDNLKNAPAFDYKKKS